MKMWFLVALMMGTADGGSADFYVFQKPYFNSDVQCIEFVKENNYMIYTKLTEEFPGRGLQNLYCVPQDGVEKLLKEGYEVKNETSV